MLERKKEPMGRCCGGSGVTPLCGSAVKIPIEYPTQLSTISDAPEPVLLQIPAQLHIWFGIAIAITLLWPEAPLLKWSLLNVLMSDIFIVLKNVRANNMG